ncbi:MAG: hypothetical protein ACJ763_00885 [Bdellovibrionia bacterium]
MHSMRQIGPFHFSILTLGLLSSTAWAAQTTTPQAPAKTVMAAPSATPSASPDLGNRIQAYFSDSRKQLGSMEPWQQRLFNEEAVPDYQRFVRGYRMSNTTLNADIDLESLKNFLRFYAPKSLKREKPSIVAVLKPQANCSKCVSGLPELKTMVSSRLERRGFKVVWVSASELGEASLTGQELVAAAKQSATQKDAVGALVVYWQRSVDDDDAMHPDERHYTIHSALELRDLASAQEQLEIADNGSFERSEGKLLTDAFTEIGAKLVDLEVSQAEIKREETTIDVIGIHSFAQYQALKNAFQGAIKTGTLEEQKISRGRAIFAVYSSAPVQKIQQAIDSSKPEGLKLGPSTIEANEIHLEVTTAQAAPNSSQPQTQPAEQSGAQPKAGKPAPAQAPEGDPEA